MLIDEVHVNIKAGDGGDGFVHMYHDRHRPHGGPDGGDGGDGGSVYFEAVSDISRLNQFRHAKDFKAESGQNGKALQSSGKKGEDLVLLVPVGTVVNYDNGTSVEMIEVGQKEMIAKGGKGGWGNHHFRSATNQQPKESTPGQKRPLRALFLQLKLIAQVGLIGLPNTGKTSLLNELTSAAAKVANYPFTTLEPNLGVMKGGFIIADIPGLIEGASEGKGLGVQFLKHIERTKLLIHCLSCESTDLLADYKTVRQELTNYSSTLSLKPELIVLTKTDLITAAAVKKLITKLHANLAVSIIDTPSIVSLNRLISQKLSEL